MNIGDLFEDGNRKRLIERKAKLLKYAMYLREDNTPMRGMDDYKAKLQTLKQILADPDTARDPMLRKEVQRRLGQLHAEADKLGLNALSEDGDLNVGDPVVITGGVNFKGETGDVVGFGSGKKFVIVDLYNHGRHRFHRSDVEYNDYAGSDDEEARMYGQEPWDDDQADDNLGETANDSNAEVNEALMNSVKELGGRTWIDGGRENGKRTPSDLQQRVIRHELKKRGELGEEQDKLQGTPVVSLADFDDKKDFTKDRYGRTVPKKIKKDDPRVTFYKDKKPEVAETTTGELEPGTKVITKHGRLPGIVIQSRYYPNFGSFGVLIKTSSGAKRLYPISAIEVASDELAESNEFADEFRKMIDQWADKENTKGRQISVRHGPAPRRPVSNIAPRAEQPVSDEQRAGLEAKLRELESKFDPNYDRSDDYTFWSQQNQIGQQIASIKHQLAIKEGKVRDIERALSQHAKNKVDQEKADGDLSPADRFSYEQRRKQLLAKKRRVQSEKNRSPLEELSKDTLSSYQRKVSADSQKNRLDPSKRPASKANKSVAGFAKASKRLEKTVEAKQQSGARKPEKDDHESHPDFGDPDIGLTKGEVRDAAYFNGFNHGQAGRHGSQAKTWGEKVDEAKGLSKKVKIVKGPADALGREGWIVEIRHGAYKGAPKTYTVDYENDNGETRSIQLPGNALRLVKDQQLDEILGFGKKAPARKPVNPEEKKRQDAAWAAAKQNIEANKKPDSHWGKIDAANDKAGKARATDYAWAQGLKEAGSVIGGGDPGDSTASPVGSISELSNDTLGSYKKKAGADARQLDKKGGRGDTEKANRRFHGIVQATKKEFKNDAKRKMDEEIAWRLDEMKREGYDI
jgi:hypothetical protein